MTSFSLPDWLQSVYHNSSETYVSNPNPALNDTVTVHLRVGLNATIRKIFLRTFPDGEQAFTPIRRIGGDTGWYYGNWLW